MSYQELRVHAEAYWHAQEFRKAMTNKVRSEMVDSDVIQDALADIAAAESKFAKAMISSFRTAAGPNVIRWQKQSKGIGEHLLARLLGVIGDPYVASPMHWEKGPEGGDARVLVSGDPFLRNVDKLWAYCGYGDPSRKRRKNMSAEDAMALGNPKAKTILRLIAESCVKTTSSPYRLVYDKARDTYEGRIHENTCPQCKGSSEPGQPWRPGHQHAAALRKVAKEVLVDLWEAARADYWQAKGLAVPNVIPPAGEGQCQVNDGPVTSAVTPDAAPEVPAGVIPEPASMVQAP